MRTGLLGLLGPAVAQAGWKDDAQCSDQSVRERAVVSVGGWHVGVGSDGADAGGLDTWKGIPSERKEGA